MASKKSPQSRFLGDLPMEGGISQKEKYRYVAHLMFFIGCALFSFGIWALSGFTASSGSTGPFPFWNNCNPGLLDLKNRLFNLKIINSNISILYKS